jgi:adenylate kinase family enzyme
VLGPADELGGRPARVLVAGTSGAGKSTVARLVAGVLGVPYTEMDSLFHGAGWVPRPSFEADVDALIARDSWVAEWQYSPVRARMAARADLMIWLDLPRPVVMAQVIGRTIGRQILRRPIFNGNREPPPWTIFTDRDHIIRWAWTTHHRTATRIAALHTDRPDLRIVRLKSRREIRAWLAGPLRESTRPAHRLTPTRPSASQPDQPTDSHPPAPPQVNPTSPPTHTHPQQPHAHPTPGRSRAHRTIPPPRAVNPRLPAQIGRSGGTAWRNSELKRSRLCGRLWFGCGRPGPRRPPRVR